MGDDVHFGFFMRDHLKIPLFQSTGFHNENFAIEGCTAVPCSAATKLRLIVYHDFHRQHNQLISRPITFHMRFGAQAGMGGANEGLVTEATFGLLKSAIDALSPNLPSLVDEDLAAIKSK
eukprot:TRINITY_DN3020_c0_g1_i3.p1 TRINITY_DN3020_c0_g1~~TRINITY_DN3020_c0_g1_i3.p1  ORF type:complete len:128 (+),score=48.99 TRINITY_DN3020_c0_g1_i3:27-386(+)